jgi:hypothetical protein
VTATTRVLFSGQLCKAVDVHFDTEAMTSDGGVLLLGALDGGLGLTKVALSALTDARDPTRIVHSQLDMLRQRIYGLGLGYEDCNDSARIAHDPAVKLAVGRGLDEADLASAATLCRFENSVSPRELVNAARTLLKWRLTSLRKRFKKARVVTIDFDSTPDPTHGQQELAFYDGHYDTYSYKPLVVSLSFDDDLEQYVVAVRLRPGKSKEDRTVIPFLRRLVKKLKTLFKKARVRVRADSGFGKSPRLLDALDALPVEYVLAYQTLDVLKTLAQPWADEAQALHDQGLVGVETQVFGEFMWQPKKGTWPHERRIVAKAEVTETHGREPRLNLRFVVSNAMGRFKPSGLYKVYRERGDSENRIKELKQLELDRTSCHRFRANALRVLLATVAYMLVQELRWRLRRTSLRRAQASTLRERLFKMAARVEETVRRFVLHCPIDFPWAREWRQAALAVGAVPR